jgi:hypothetical protein
LFFFFCEPYDCTSNHTMRAAVNDVRSKKKGWGWDGGERKKKKVCAVKLQRKLFRLPGYQNACLQFESHVRYSKLRITCTVLKTSRPVTPTRFEYPGTSADKTKTHKE